MLQRLFKAAEPQFKLSIAMSHILKANALKEYKHYEEALVEAEKAKKVPSATASEVELAKGKAVEILYEIELQKKSPPKL